MEQMGNGSFQIVFGRMFEMGYGKFLGTWWIFEREVLVKQLIDRMKRLLLGGYDGDIMGMMRRLMMVTRMRYMIYIINPM